MIETIRQGLKDDGGQRRRTPAWVEFRRCSLAESPFGTSYSGYS